MAKGNGNTRKSGPPASYPVARASDLIISPAQIISQAQIKIRNIFSAKAAGDNPDPTPFEIGVLDNNIISSFTSKTGIVVESDVIYSSAGTLTHHKTGTKATRGKVITASEAESIPGKLGTMDVYEHDGAFVFTDYNIKVIVKPNQKIKINRTKTIVANHTSSSRVLDINEFLNGDYVKIK